MTSARVEEVAKIIDPHSFMDIPFTDDPVLLDMVEQSKQDAIRKAERILSSLAAPAAAPTPGDAREALEAAEETLRLVEHPARRDPKHGDEVEALGLRIGFGALMASASASWRDRLGADGDPVGGEFVAGPCHASVIATLAKIRSALGQMDSNNG